MMYETLSLNCHHDSILKRLSRSTLHCLVTEESEAGEEHALAPVLVAAPGALVVELETKAMRSYTKRESPSRGLSVITNLRMDLRFKLYRQHRQHYLQGDRKLGIIIRWESCQLFSYLITTNTQSYIPSRQITDVRAPASPTRKSTAFFRCENKAQNMSKNQIPVTFSVLVLFVFQKLFCLALKSLPLFG